jgi:hypothetical protein
MAEATQKMTNAAGTRNIVVCCSLPQQCDRSWAIGAPYIYLYFRGAPISVIIRQRHAPYEGHYVHGKDATLIRQFGIFIISNFITILDKIDLTYGNRHSAVGTGTILGARRPRNYGSIPSMRRDLLSWTSRPVLGPNQPHMERLAMDVPSRLKALAIHLHLVSSGS